MSFPGRLPRTNLSRFTRRCRGLALCGGQKRAVQLPDLTGEETVTAGFICEPHEEVCVMLVRKFANPSQESFIQLVSSRVLPILTYHHVGPSKADVHPLLTVSPGDFAEQIDWLARRNYSPITTLDWNRWLFESRPLPKKPLLITFDDGYADIAQ